MLDAETKRRIDTARDILVGKVPDPKSQVEQITIALIYKFMDDMDRESVEMGGKRGFFIGEYEKYSWSNIFNPRLGGHEMLNLYAEAITRMSQNPNLPELFRNIFKNAYLPYRDPETLKLFLKTINDFAYDHSERLGDAFEYLLSVLGSQGDAGQFRTPRHIIDFMVEIIAPKKNELILDPACGTAGFLISAYKHIMRENTSEKYRLSNGNGRGDLLTTEERKKLLTNFKGYDISPDMVRLSLVNMYLHGFVDPKIFEYDTLTSEDRWNEYADVILANPPFMTPKGGIKPHKRFSVQSNRSEVLFVDYIAEHLTPTGRAAVIVPEGIIFQSANAYKQLRKMLVENYLYAVVSLPAGVFQPYSGVKTSILLMDKVLAQKSDNILFVKIENDGFDLGAQRRPIDRNDLPDALQVIREYIDKVRNGKLKTFKPEVKPCSALIVKKEKLAENGEYNLTGDRYRVVEKRKHQKWPMVRLGEVCEISSGNSAPQNKSFFENGKYPFFRTSDVGKRHLSDNLVECSDYLNDEGIKGLTKFKKGTILFPKSGASIFLNHRAILGVDGYVSNHLATIYPNEEKALSKYIYLILIRVDAKKLTSEQDYPSLRLTDIANIQIPLPPLEVQKEIVAEIESYQKIIDSCRQVIDAWKPDVETYLDEELKTYLAEHPEKQEELSSGWPMVKLGEIGEIKYGYTASAQEKGEARFIRITDISENGTLINSDSKYTSLTDDNLEYLLKKGDLLVARTGATYGKTLLFNENYKAIFASYLIRIRFPQKEIIPEYYWAFSQSRIYWKQAQSFVTGGGQPQFNGNVLKQIQIPLPPLEVQSRIVDKIESERKVIDSLREMVKTYEKKIKRVIDSVWGDVKE